MYKITHTPFTTREPYTVVEDLNLDDARARLTARAARLVTRFPGAEVSWDTGGLGYEVTDDEALMIGDYQGRTEIRRQETDDD